MYFLKFYMDLIFFLYGHAIQKKKNYPSISYILFTLNMRFIVYTANVALRFSKP